MEVRFAILMGLAGWMLALPLWAANAPSLPERYLVFYVGVNNAERAERHGDFKGALEKFEDCYTRLQKIQAADPDWEEALVLHRMSDVKSKILELGPKVNAAAPLAPMPFASPLPLPHNIYPWKANAPVAQIWIGKDGVKASAWDEHWERDFGGPDTPDNRNGYSTGGHACGLNPFYVALPFNDLKHADLARQWLPKGWARAGRNGVARSACRDRWLELKNARGDVCYAQWEDSGPKGDDRAEYVFGSGALERGEAGIGLSPAAYEYL
jgi:hypothetical protein